MSRHRPTPVKVRKIAILGSRSVGKSSLTLQFIADPTLPAAAPPSSGTSSAFSEAYYPTVEQTYTKSFRFHGHEYSCELIDTAGQDEHSILPSKHVLNIHGYVLVYSIASRTSFHIVKIIRDKILDMLGVDSVPIVLVGNKADLGQSARQVSMAEGQELAGGWGCAFVEVSAKTNLNIRRIFELGLIEIGKAEGDGAMIAAGNGSNSGVAGCIVL